MGNIGSTELLLILALALLLLGPKRLPEVGAALGRTMRRFREASRELRDELDPGPQADLRRELDLRRDLAESDAPDAGRGPAPDRPAPPTDTESR